MSAQATWHAQMEAVRRGHWDTMSGYFAPDCTRALMPPGTTFRGPAEIARFMQGGFNAAAEREEAVYHVNASGLIDRVNEYAAAIPGLPA